MTKPSLSSALDCLTRRDFLAVASAAAAGVGLAGCMRNPVTGEKQLMLMGEGEEIAIDRSQSPHQISEDFGVVPLSGLNAYLARVGTEMAARTHRPQMPYSFQAVEASHVNAYAFPGGTIACTRGILLALEDEAQLAALLGHELGHVNARHSASRMSKGMLVQLAAVGATAAVAQRNEKYAPLAAAAGALGAGLLLARYSRDDERQADGLGLDYMVKAGHRPGGMVGLMNLLVSLHQKEPGRLELMFASHPMGTERLENTRRDITEKYASLSNYPANRERYQDSLAPLRRFKPAVEATQRGDRSAAKPEEALAHYAAALKAVPDDYEALIKAARVQLVMNRAREARELATRAQAARPGEPQALAASALAGIQLKDFQGAKREVQAYQKALPGNPGMLFLEGYCEDNLGRKPEAVALYRRYLASGPSGKSAEVAAARLKELDPAPAQPAR